MRTWRSADIGNRGMQECFRRHPDEYGAELEDDEEGEGPSEGKSQDVPEGQPPAKEANPEDKHESHEEKPAEKDLPPAPMERPAEA
jgi:mitochondrial intermembrane space import and assembly protein 40